MRLDGLGSEVCLRSCRFKFKAARAGRGCKERGGGGCKESGGGGCEAAHEDSQGSRKVAALRA